MKIALAIILLHRASLGAADEWEDWLDPALAIEAERALQGKGELSLLPIDLLCARRAHQESTQNDYFNASREKRRPDELSAAEQSLYVLCMIDEALRRGYE